MGFDECFHIHAISNERKQDLTQKMPMKTILEDEYAKRDHAVLDFRSKLSESYIREFGQTRVTITVRGRAK